MKNYSRLINSMPISYMKQRILYKEGKAADYMIIEVNPEFEHLFDKKEVFINKKGSELSHSRLTQYMQTCSFVLMQNKKISVQYYHEPSDRYLNVLIISSCT